MNMIQYCGRLVSCQRGERKATDDQGRRRWSNSRETAVQAPPPQLCTIRFRGTSRNSISDHGGIPATTAAEATSIRYIIIILYYVILLYCIIMYTRTEFRNNILWNRTCLLYIYTLCDMYYYYVYTRKYNTHTRIAYIYIYNMYTYSIRRALLFFPSVLIKNRRDRPSFFLITRTRRQYTGSISRAKFNKRFFATKTH